MSLTPAQRTHLVMLLTAGAIAEVRAANVYELQRRGRAGFPSALVIGKLFDMGLARKKSRATRGQRFTVYWLSIDGEREARALAEASAAAPRERVAARLDGPAPARAVRPGTEID